MHFALGLLLGCGFGNPAAVSRERHPDHYSAVEAATDPPAPATQPVEPKKAPDLTELPGETVVIDAAAEDAANDPVFPPRLDVLFDGDTTTLSRTEDVNPLILLYRFEAPIRLASVRIFPSFSTYDWAVRADPGQPRFMVREAAEDRWSRIDLPVPVETSEVRLEMRRLVRDNYVHINEVELLQAPP